MKFITTGSRPITAKWKVNANGHSVLYLDDGFRIKKYTTGQTRATFELVAVEEFITEFWTYSNVQTLTAVVSEVEKNHRHDYTVYTMFEPYKLPDNEDTTP